MEDDSRGDRERDAVLGRPARPHLRRRQRIDASRRDRGGDRKPRGRGAASAGDLSHVERQMLLNILHFGEKTAGDVAVPRGDIFAVPAETSFEGLIAAFAEAGHSRMPVYEGSLDTVIGMIHVKDVFAVQVGGAAPPDDIRDADAHAALRAGIDGHARSARADARRARPPRHRRRRVRRHRGPAHHRGRGRGDRRRDRGRA